MEEAADISIYSLWLKKLDLGFDQVSIDFGSDVWLPLGCI